MKEELKLYVIESMTNYDNKARIVWAKSEGHALQILKEDHPEIFWENEEVEELDLNRSRVIWVQQ